MGDSECAFDIYTMNPDGSGVVNLTAAQLGENHALDDEPSWPPDGTKIAFVSRRDCADDSSPSIGDSRGWCQARPDTGKVRAN